MNDASVDWVNTKILGFFVIYLKDKTELNVIILTWVLCSTLGQVWVQHIEGRSDAELRATISCDVLLLKPFCVQSYLSPFPRLCTQPEPLSWNANVNGTMVSHLKPYYGCLFISGKRSTHLYEPAPPLKTIFTFCHSNPSVARCSHEFLPHWNSWEPLHILSFGSFRMLSD